MARVGFPIYDAHTRTGPPAVWIWTISAPVIPYVRFGNAQYIGAIVATVDDAAKLRAISLVPTIVFSKLKDGWTVTGVCLRRPRWPG